MTKPITTKKKPYTNQFQSKDLTQIQLFLTVDVIATGQLLLPVQRIGQKADDLVGPFLQHFMNSAFAHPFWRNDQQGAIRACPQVDAAGDGWLMPNFVRDQPSIML